MVASGPARSGSGAGSGASVEASVDERPHSTKGHVMRLDPLTLELLRNYLHGAVEDMAYAVERTAHTTFVKETADFTCGLLTPAGDFFAYPVELGVASMAGINYARTLEAVGPLEPGDVVITNDPYGSAAAATHLQIGRAHV